MVVFHYDPLGILTFLFVHVLLLYGDIASVYVVIEYGQHEGIGRTIAAIGVHIVYLLAVVSHLRASLSDPGYVPQSRIKIDFSSDLDNKEKRKRKMHPRMDEWSVCTKCETYRPPRSHHCRICKRCVRRMDHHCPWINNCVGQVNYKYFFLFVFYTDVLCCYGLVLVIWDWIYHWHEDHGTIDRLLTIGLFFEAVIFGLFVGGMFLAQSMSIIFDRNAIEIKRYGPPMGTNRSPKLWRFTAFFGRGSKLCWPVPCIKSQIPPDPAPPTSNTNDTNINEFV